VANRLAIGILGAFAALGVTWSGDADAYAVKRTSHGDLVHWEHRELSFSVDPSVEAAVRGGLQATRDAMDGWSGTVGAPILHATPADDTSPKKPGFDEKNAVFYAAGGHPAAGYALAITVLTYDNTSGRILDADVIFNGIYDFAVLSAAEPLKAERSRLAHPTTTDDVLHDGEASIDRESIYDLHHVVAHELGHSLGMNDEMGKREALMYRYSAPNDASMRQPASDDIAGLAELYSTKLEGRGGCGSATVAPKKPTRSSSTAAMAFGLALLVFLGARTRRDVRARAAFVVAAAAGLVLWMPTVSTKAARASEPDLRNGHARARIVEATSTIGTDGLFRTHYALATTECRTVTCPKSGKGLAWGGTIGDLTQEVGGSFAPTAGDAVDVSFAKLPQALEPLKPLAGRTPMLEADVRVITRAVR
jgi:hypothetical protein